MTEALDQIAVMEALECLGDLSLTDLQRLMEKLAPVSLASGDSLYAKGQPAESFYFLGSGRLKGITEGGEEENFKPGRLIGWRAFFHKTERVSSVWAERDSLLYSLSRSDFDALVNEHPFLLKGFLNATTKRPKSKEPFLTFHAETAREIALVELDDSAQGYLDALLSRFSAEMEIEAPKIMTFADLIALTGSSAETVDLQGSMTSDVLSQLEMQFECLLLVARKTDPVAWRNKVASLSQVMLIVGGGILPETAPSWFPPEADLQHKTLGAVLEVQGSMPAFAENDWRSKLNWTYRLEGPSDPRCDSAVRMALGRGVNFVLSGGGSLGAIHCGVLTALVEDKFPIDSIGGTSIGACISYIVAAGMDFEESAAHFRSIFLEKGAFSKYTFPRFGVLDPTTLERELKKLSKGLNLEDARMPTFLISTNLSKARLEVLQSGPAWEAMRMSSSLPVLLPAFIRHGSAYVDGGLLSNMPVEVSRELYAGFAVSMNLSVKSTQDLEAKYEDRPRLIGALLDQFGLREGTDYPTVGEVLVKAMVLKSDAALQHALDDADLVLQPQVPTGIRITDFKRFDELFDLGYRFGKEKIQELTASGRLATLRLFKD